MSNTSIPRVVISGLRGGSGKTLLSLSLLSVLGIRGMRTAPFKKGPDYIDAGWLARASGVPCYNLDLFMMSPDQALGSFIERTQGSQLALIEGNRGLFDGMDSEGTYSTAQLARLLRAPVILSVDCTKSTNTIAALVLGCLTMDREVPLRGVVLNQVATKRQEKVIREAVKKRCNVPVLGAIPRLKKDPFPERHMGLTPFQEHAGIEEALTVVGDMGKRYLDVDEILKVAGQAGSLPGQKDVGPQSRAEHREGQDEVRIGVIRDSAFQFYYQENLEELEKKGAALVDVSPLDEKSVPDVDALYIGGGFPETHAISLAENEGFRMSLRQEITKGLPVYAECGGLMYLGERLVLGDRTYPMVGALPVSFGLKSRPQAHGYTVVEVHKENPYFPQKTVLRGHEFHYSHVLDYRETGGISLTLQVKRGRGIVDGRDGLSYRNVFAAYTHLHALGSPEWVDGMIQCARKFRRDSVRSRGAAET